MSTANQAKAVLVKAVCAKCMETKGQRSKATSEQRTQPTHVQRTSDPQLFSPLVQAWLAIQQTCHPHKTGPTSCYLVLRKLSTCISQYLILHQLLHSCPSVKIQIAHHTSSKQNVTYIFQAFLIDCGYIPRRLQILLAQNRIAMFMAKDCKPHTSHHHFLLRQSLAQCPALPHLWHTSAAFFFQDGCSQELPADL